MKTFAVSIVLIFFVSLSFAQKKYLPGSIITLENDTIVGKINDKIKPGAGKVKFIDSMDKKKTYYPRQVNGFVINDSIYYQSILQTENAEATAYHIFALLICDGYYRLLGTKDKAGSMAKPSTEQKSSDGFNFYIQESKTGKYFKLTKISYRNQLADLIDEYTELRREVRNKVYNYDEIPEVIEKYNDWKSDQKN